MSTESMKAVSRRWYEELFNQGQLDGADLICAATYTSLDPYGPPGGWPIGPGGAKALVTTYRTAFPDVTFTVEEQIAEGGSVATRWSTRGTQNGLLPGGITPTGKPVTVAGISIERHENGMIVESCVSWDFFGMMQQLGVIPAPGA
jgi:predicted ester cyclase